MSNICNRAAVAGIAAMALLLPGLAPAQPAEPQGQVQDLVEEYRQVAEALGKIRDKAVESHPELEKKSEAFQAKLEEEMVADGYDIEAERKKMERLGAQLESEDVSPEQEQELLTELRTEQVEMYQARRSVMKKPEVQSAGQELQEATLLAMREQNRNTDTLMERMRELRSQIQARTAPGGAAQE